ncbi:MULTISPECIES: GrpB family protein [Deinococcus]|uniref:GrpB family protein n=1 Tax=Deinococcus rufus TaxID=2136097 RepID=A0ABV7Z3X2_9DEIO|nr:GrpB family protein [Deinococcus sp. AB2017081]WQE95460.1 GrpB family protein [Deinococcus sp. AB2017081]
MPDLPPVPTDPPLTDEEMRAAFVVPPPRLTGPILVVPSDPQWPALYAREAARLRRVLGARALALEHVGSTSVPGLSAKPIIDLDLTVADSADEAAYVPELEAAGYVLTIREPGWHEHRMFGGPDTDINLHVWSPGSPEAIRHVVFRDWLRAHDDDRHAYDALKRDLATRPYTYMHEYNNDKAALIREIYARAVASQA